MSNDRYNRARIEGAGTLRREEWAKVVDEAVQLARDSRPRPDEMFAGPVPFRARKTRHVVLHDRQMVVSTQMVLDVEAALALSEMVEQGLKELAESPDVSEARRERLLARLAEAAARIKRRVDGVKA